MIKNPPLKWHQIELPEVSGVEFRRMKNAPGYAVGSDGTIWSCWRFKGSGRGKSGQQVLSRFWKRLKPDCRKEDGRKRYTVKLSSGDYRRAYGSHFVLEAFVGQRPEGMEACHWDGDCKNDSAENLRWDTPIANKADMQRHGTQVKGENHPKAKLSDSDVGQVIDLRKQGMKLKQIAKLFGVSETRVYQICKKGSR